MREGLACTKVRLDSGMGNVAWKGLFPNTCLRLLHSSHLDHNTICLTLSPVQNIEGEEV